MINSHGDRYSVNNTFNVEPNALKYQRHCFNMTSRDFIAGMHAGRDYCGSRRHVTESDFRQSDSHLSCHWVCSFVFNMSGEICIGDTFSSCHKNTRVWGMSL